MRLPLPADSPALERAEQLVEQVEEEVTRLTKAALARALELAEDLWAEAQSTRQNSSGR